MMKTLLLVITTETGDMALYFLGAAVLFFIAVAVTRWIFSIKRILAYQKAQIRLLAALCRQQGVESDKVDQILSNAEADAR